MTLPDYACGWRSRPTPLYGWAGFIYVLFFFFIIFFCFDII